MAFEDQFRTDYQSIAASKSAVALAGQVGKGAAGDLLDRVMFVPATTSPGAVSITDGDGPSITIFPGGASSVADLKPFFVDIRARSLNGAWKLTTGANISVVAVGRFQ